MRPLSMVVADPSSLFDTQHWIVTRAAGLEGGFLLDGLDRLMTANFAVDDRGSQLLQLRWRSSTDVVELAGTDRGLVVSGVAPDADDLSVTSAPRARDARTSDVFGLLASGTEITVDVSGTRAAMVLRQPNGHDVTLDLLAWEVPFASQAALVVHDHCGFHPVDGALAGGLQEAAFARDGLSGAMVFSRFLLGREFFEIQWNRAGFNVIGVFEYTGQAGKWPDEQPLIPSFPGRPINPGDSFTVILNGDLTVELRNDTQGWAYLLSAVGVG